MALVALVTPALWPCGLAAQERLREFAPTGRAEDGAAVSLEIVLSRPLGPGPFPLFVFNHGSTGRGDDPSAFRHTRTANALAHALNQRGWMVAFPQRRGRGQSGGRYDEGFEPDRSRYSCVPELSLKGVERALEDVRTAVQHLLARPDVDARRLVVGGVSRGGILSVAYAGEHPGQVAGVVNWVGGWMSDRCPDPVAINTATFVRGARFAGETLWLYGENDSYYSMTHSRANFEAFRAAGGRGRFNAYSLGLFADGHGLLQRDDLWLTDLAAFLERIR